MKNIPVFISQGGTATLILTEIPHRGIAYVVLRTVIPGGLSPMLQECAAFCHSCGAKLCFVSPGDTGEQLPFPHAYDIYHLRIAKSSLPILDSPISLTPINPDNDTIYQQIYNQCFQSVSHALTYDRSQIDRIYRCGQQAFLALTNTGTPCGIGELHENELAAVGLLPDYRGCGMELTLSLLAHCPGPEITLTVASDNLPALKLYSKLGFSVCGIESKWYDMDLSHLDKTP